MRSFPKAMELPATSGTQSISSQETFQGVWEAGILVPMLANAKLGGSKS